MMNISDSKSKRFLFSWRSAGVRERQKGREREKKGRDKRQEGRADL